ncbi:MAG TPA: Nif3-like dinuclear metal center hexameric protein [Acidimicrobiia bacterium]|nr:Nif3-like dinuclear metal center hexameric protein [Acidimicrobiia bacterium]
MATVADIALRLAERTNPDQTPDWDPVGLQVGDPAAIVDRIGVCHEVNDAVVSVIESEPVDLLVTYHPLLFTPTTRVLAGHSPGARSYRLIRSKVSLLVTHTDFDSAPGGTADALAGFFDLTAVGKFGADPESGLDNIGRYGGFQGTLGTIDAMVSDRFGPIGIRISGDRDAEVERVSVVPGSGGAFIEAAAEVSQVLVTGDVSHHRAVAARDQGLSIVDPGHTATERPGMAALVDMVRGVSDAEVIDLTGIDPQTWS